MARSYRAVAAAVAKSKAAHPEQFCPFERCLWRTGGGRCPRHPDPSLPDTGPRACGTCDGTGAVAISGGFDACPAGCEGNSL